MSSGGVVVAVAGQTAHPGVPVKAVTARRVGNQTEEVLAAKVVDPGRGVCGVVMTYSLFWSSKYPNFIMLPP